MSRSQQDQIIEDDENETCPLCIEEFDLSDRGFKPCPCGYQICQFCYNNIKTTMNGLCPACRRPYDDKNIQWKMPTTEELMSHKENVANAAKKKAAARQKEMAKREADTLSRRHLQGIRVRQKNLVYVTGMKPTSSPEHLSEMLRRDEYFGQYGKIVKVVVSKAKEGQVNAPVGIYVTFESKESAARCIAAVDGSQNFDTKLRAQYGTTKYCSAYLRGEQCTKQGCLFLHEPGEENESFTRQDLSSMNSMHTQLPAHGNSTFGRAPQSDPPPQHAPQTIAAAAPPMDRESSRDGSASGVESNEGPALPAGATWARNAPSRRASQAPSASTSSPLAQSAVPATTGPPSEVKRSAPTVPRLRSALSHEAVRPEETLSDLSNLDTPLQKRLSFLNIVKDLFVDSDLHFEFDESAIDPQKMAEIDAMPPLFDDNGGLRRLAALKQHESNDRKESEAAQVTRQALSSLDLDEAADPGSLQLGGEPDEQQGPGLDQFRRHHAIQPPTSDRLTSPGPSLENTLSPSGLASRSLAPQGSQQQQFLLAQLKSASPNYLNQGMPSNPPQASHVRQASRFSFANDSTASASVKPVANPKLMNQQSSMMPPQHQFNAQSSNQLFTSGVQGPPPGLKTSGTPSVSGGGMFGQGHGFATAGLGYSANTQPRTPNDEMMRELMRARGGSAGSGQASDGGRREFMFPSSMQQISQSTSPVPAPGLSGFPYGSQAGAFPDHGQSKPKKKSKKHRHANTSSSGGGVVDHADPSILQAARMHQSGGHNLYGAQSQGQSGFSNPMMFGNTGNSGSSNNNNGFGGRW